MTKTAELTQSERAKMLAMWASPLQARIASKNPIVKATREAIERTNWRISIEIEAGVRRVVLVAHDISEGRPIGVGETRLLSRFPMSKTDELISYLEALEAPEQ